MTTDKTPQPHRLQQDPPEGDRETIDRQLADQDDQQRDEEAPSERGVALDPKRRID
jgi:hypothetical protein